MQEEVPLNAHNHPTSSPKVANAMMNVGGGQSLIHTLQGSKKTQLNNGLYTKNKPTTQKKMMGHPQTYPHSHPPQVSSQMMSSKTQASKMPKRYSDMGTIPPNADVIPAKTVNTAKFANANDSNPIQGTNGGEMGP